MSKGANQPADNPDVAGLDETDAATNQEAVVLPLLCGTGLMKVTWFMSPLNQFTKEAPATRPGKK